MRDADESLFGHALLSQSPDGFTVIKLTQSCSLDEISKLLHELARREAYRLRIFDVRGVSLSYTPEEIRQIALGARSLFTKPNRVAWVTDSDLNYGLLRIFSAYRGQEGHSVSRVFRRYENALRWLEKEKIVLDGGSPS